MAKKTVTPSVVINKDSVVITLPREDGFTSKGNKRYTASGWINLGESNSNKLFGSITIVESSRRKAA